MNSLLPCTALPPRLWKQALADAKAALLAVEESLISAQPLNPAAVLDPIQVGGGLV